MDNRLRGYVGLAAALRAGQVDPGAYLEETLERIADLDAELSAFVIVNEAAARQAAAASKERWRTGRPLSAVDGMPIAVKDIIETADMPTGQGSPIWAGTVTRRDSASVHALREAGAVIVGKTTTTEFASSHAFHQTRNPHDRERTPGGSSSGSAAAVGAGMVPAALGTQVVGSILRPASFCGAVGFKPSVGGINRAGSYDHFSQSCQGVIGASLADAWAVSRAITERAGGDPGFVGLSGDADLSGGERAPLRVAFLETGGWQATTDGARGALTEALRLLTQAGAQVSSRSDDPGLEKVEVSVADAGDLTQRINAWEGRWPLNTYTDLDAAGLSQPSRDRLRLAESMTQDDYRQLVGRRKEAREAFARAADRYDLFVTLGACGAAPKGFASTGNSAMNVAASLLGCPALTVPVLEDEGMPLGLQFLAKTDADAALFSSVAWALAGPLGRRDLIGTGG